MTKDTLQRTVIAALICASSAAHAENHTATNEGGFGVKYGDEACNNTPEFMANNDITCTAVFSETNVWDFLEGLPRRIPLETLISLNPALEIEGYETVLSGITFVRVE